MKTKLFLLTLLVMLGVSQSWGALYNKTSTITAVAVGEGGQVFASNDNLDINSITGWTNESSTTKKVSFNAYADVTQYVYAKAKEGYRFLGWRKDDQNANSYASTAQKYSISFTFWGTSSNKNDTYYAIFEKIQNYSATVSVVGLTGHVFVDGNGVSSTQSVTNTTEQSKTFSFSLTATAKEGYKFSGWSETDGGTIVSTNSSYTVSITCTPSNANVTKTYYAKFETDIEQNTNTFTNPILNQDMADPSVILAEDGYYYAYCSEHSSGEGIPVWRSEDLTNWTRINSIFGTRPDNVTYTYLWAPEIVYVNGKYLLYYANADYGTQANTQICVAESDKPYGPFVNNKILLRAHDSNNGAVNVDVDNVIDPSLFRDDDGKNYLVWGSWNGIYYIQLTDDCKSVASGATKKAIASVGSSGLGLYTGDWNKVEAPMLMKHVAKDNGKTYYYLFCSKGTTVNASDASGITYQIVCARGESLGGKFYDTDDRDVFDGNVLDGNHTMFNILERKDDTEKYYVLGPGHNSQIITDMDGKNWIFYHGYPKKDDGTWDYPGNGRLLFGDLLIWDGYYDGWPCIWPYTKGETITKPTMDPKGPDTYQIYNAADLQNFASVVNGGEVYASATLMNDIDMSGVTYTPIGTETNKFRGVINGQGYRITNLTINTTEPNQGLVGWADGGAMFKYIIIDSSCSFTGGSYTAAFLGHIQGSGTVQFFCCGNEATVNGVDGSVNTAGFVGCDSGVSLYMDNCYNMGDINGKNESAAFSGWGIDRLRNCWNTGRTLGCQGAGDGYWYSLARDWNDSKSVNTYDLNSDNAPLAVNRLANYESSWMTSGRLTYVINQGAGMRVWYQNIDASFGDEKDTHPVFLTSHLPVYNDGDTYYNVRVEKEYIRDLNNANYATFCLGYKTNATEGATFYDILAIQKNGDTYTTIVLQRVEDQQHLVAGKAYIFKPNEGSSQVRCTYWDGGFHEAIVAPGLVGNLIKDGFKVPVGDYILSGNKIKKVVGNNYINLNRAYITGFDKLHEDFDADPSKLVFFGFDGNIDEGETTDVEFVISDPENNENVLYNLAGQRISQPVRGQIYIMNGRKYLAR